MKGLRIRDGLTIIAKLVQAAPTEVQNTMEELSALGRVAATAKADETSALASTWRVMPHSTALSGTILSWKEKCLERQWRFPFHCH
jgi:hypothetical protein